MSASKVIAIAVASALATLLFVCLVVYKPHIAAQKSKDALGRQFQAAPRARLRRGVKELRQRLGLFASVTSELSIDKTAIPQLTHPEEAGAILFPQTPRSCSRAAT